MANEMLSYVPFTMEMKEAGYKILVPNMLPMHFDLVKDVMETYGYHMEVLKKTGPEIAEMGLKYVHNDACYPALLVIGQFMDALLSGEYDTHKTALIYFQTGGGCRASNYISLLRKALKKAGLEYVPVISVNFTGLEKHPGLKFTFPMLHGLLYAILYGDFLMSLVNQCRTYEKEKGATQALADKWVKRLGKELGSGGRISYRKVKDNYRAIVQDFRALPMDRYDAVKVGIVGEIYVKYSPLANNNLEQFLVDEGAEVNVPGLLDFGLYCVYNGIVDHRLYGTPLKTYAIYRLVYKLVCSKKQDMIDIVNEDGFFQPIGRFEDTVDLVQGYISQGVKMGEGWLLTAEMIELSHSGVKNIVCAQPFGCLPNHICGKAMMRPIKERNPDTNIVAIDYDPGATRVNQENRIKLMLSNAKK